jgi:MYXO-CTERM domain-containing protein
MRTVSHVGARPKIRWASGPVALAISLSVAALSVSSSALAAVYTQTITLPTPPSKVFATSGGGDGWDVALSSTQVFNVFHHNSAIQVACHNQVDASPCWPTLTRTVNDGTSNFGTPGHAGLYLDQATGKLYVYATRLANTQAGVVCVDTVAAATSTNPFCGFTPLTGPGEAPTSTSFFGMSMLSLPMKVGTKLYSFNFAPGSAPGGPTGTTSQNRLLCFDLSTGAACAGQPFSVDLGSTGAVGFTTPAPATNVIGSQLIIPALIGGTYKVACFDGAAQTACAGTWPIATGPYAGNNGPVIPLLDTTSAPVGFCLPNNSGSCFTLTGASATTPPGFTSTITATTPWQGPATIVGPRVYSANGNLNSVVQCYDYSTSASCAGFPKSFGGLSYIYTVNKDPARPTCLWLNADGGPQQIQNFDAYSGGACNGIRVLAAQFVVPQVKCNPASYVSLQMLDPAPGNYTSATVEFDNGAGNPLGIPNKTLDSTGTVDLTGLSLNTATGLPQFLITLAGASASLGQVTLELTWVTNYDPSCVTGTVSKEATTVTTSLTGGGTTGTSIVVASGTAVTDGTTVAGANASGASGTVTYTWYSDAACTVVASAGSPEAIATPGALPGSAPVTLGPGTYYPVVSYSGDAGNLASSSHCGDEVVKVSAPVSSNPPSCALTAVVNGPPKQLQITVQSAMAGIATVEVTESNNASTVVPSFSPGATGALVVTATKIDQSQGAQVALRVTDVNGLVTNCDPVVPGEAASSDRPSSPQGCSVAGNGGAMGFEGLALGVMLGLGLLRRRRTTKTGK